MRTEDLSAQREVQESLKLSFIIEIVHTGTPEKNSIKEIKIIMRIDSVANHHRYAKRL